MLRVLMSACLYGKDVMYWGGNIKTSFFEKIISHPQIKTFFFCPEDVVFGTPRNNMLLHGGDGGDLWNNNARLYDTEGQDCTEKSKEGARQMLRYAQEVCPDLVILTEGSDSCGSTVVLDPVMGEEKQKPTLKPGVGVATALLQKYGFLTLSHQEVEKIDLFIQEKLQKDTPHD